MKIYLRKEVKEIIAYKNWTYTDFGEKIDCTASYVSRLLNQEIEASAQRRKKIMKALKNYSFDDLFIIKNNN